MALHLVPGTGSALVPSGRHRKRKPKVMICCHVCGGQEVVESRIGATMSATRRASGGTKSWLCLFCLMRGRRIPLL